MAHPDSSALEPKTDRIQGLDVIRGVAVLGILAMNSVMFGLSEEAYFDLAAGGFDSQLDKIIGIAGEVFVDRKAMALFSLLFGAGVVLFADRAAAKGRRPNLLSLWRNVILLGIGIAHAALWQGDVLLVYAICAPVVLLVRRLPPFWLLCGGVFLAWASALDVGWACFIAPPESLDSLGWTEAEEWFVVWIIFDVFARALGMMLCGAALYRMNWFNSAHPKSWSWRGLVIALPAGLGIAAAGVYVQLSSDDTLRNALLSEALGVVATPFIAFGYLGILDLWIRRPATAVKERIAAVGRMALTNYLTQTLLGVFVLGTIAGQTSMSRTWIAVFVVAVWILQLAWSKAWLRKFWFGPAEWLWRCATYRRRMPMAKQPRTQSP